MGSSMGAGEYTCDSVASYVCVCVCMCVSIIYTYTVDIIKRQKGNS